MQIGSFAEAEQGSAQAISHWRDRLYHRRVGAVAALVSALLWAATSTALTALSARSSAVVLSGVRLGAATLCIPVVVILAGGSDEFSGATPTVIFALVASGALGYGIGDTAYIRSLSLLGMQRVFPVSIAGYIGLTVVGGGLFLGESLGPMLLLGAGLIALGITLVVVSSAERPLEGIPVSGPAPPALDSFADLGPVVVLPRRLPRWASRNVEGYALLVLVSLTWAGATLWLAWAGSELGAVATWAVRTPVGAAGLLLVSFATRRARLRALVSDRNQLTVVVVAGIVGTALGSLCYVFSVVEVGAARAAVLSATSPLMALPLAVIFLKERITVRVVSGTLACVAGIALVVGA
jgi:drug/metabolite transporter (DMT)-like permease